MDQDLQTLLIILEKEIDNQIARMNDDFKRNIKTQRIYIFSEFESLTEYNGFLISE